MKRGRTQRTSGLAVLLSSLALLTVSSVASAQVAVRTIRFHGYAVTVPRAWPVYYLGSDPARCVRFDRHALYLGMPGSAQRCPAHAAGRTEAILIEPLPAHASRAAHEPSAPLPGLDRHATSFTVRTAGVLVTATWSGAESVVAHALHRRALPPAHGPRTHARARSPRAAHSAATIYNGLGFDACSAPSPSDMSAWGSSPYRAIGIYIGGVNEACAQPNLTSSWTSAEVAGGWHLIPTYVGLQAPNNSCGCAAISTSASQASAEGTAAASDAVSDAAAIGLPAGNPIYYDMEAYSRGSTNSPPVLAFLSAWTSQLHADGYASGVYSSASSGITDLVNQQGTGYLEPDDIWIADWNGEQTTDDPYVPATDWSNQQRLHQYRGGHDETYGGVTINIDNNYLDGATVDTTSGTVSPQTLPSTPPALTLTPLVDGITDIDASWSGAVGVTAWRVLAGFDSTGATLAPITTAAAKSNATRIAVHNAAPYFAVQALGSSGQVLGTSPPTPMPAHIALVGPSTFAPARGGLARLPVGCYTGALCRIRLTLRAGHTLIASTGTEYIGTNSGGMLYYSLTRRGRALLARARGNRLAVQATARDASGVTATMKLNLVAISTSGRPPARHVAQSATVRLLNTFDYVSSRGVGGILTTCRNTAVCQISTTLKVGHTTIARTGPEYLGANELRYLTFSLSSRGKALLRSATGNQLPAQLTLTDAGASATARIVLTRFI